MLEVWLSKSNLKMIMKTVYKRPPQNSLLLFSRYHLWEHLLWLWLCTILWWGQKQDAEVLGKILDIKKNAETRLFPS